MPDDVYMVAVDLVLQGTSQHTVITPVFRVVQTIVPQLCMVHKEFSLKPRGSRTMRPSIFVEGLCSCRRSFGCLGMK